MTSSNLQFALTFKDLGTYTLSIGVDSGPRTTFHVVVLPAGSVGTTFAGFWDASVFYPPGSVVATGAIFTGLDFWIEANTSGTMSQPALGASDWYHIAGPATAVAGPPGPAGPQGPAGSQGPAGVGLPTGSVITLPANQAPPAGVTFLGSATLSYVDGTNHPRKLDVKHYQLP